MKRYIVAVLLTLVFGINVSTAAEKSYIQTIEESQIPGTYCMGFALISSTGAKAAWDGAPFEFKIITRDQYADIVREQIRKTQSAAMPNDGIYLMVEDTTPAHDVEVTKAFQTYGWNWLKEHHDSIPMDKIYKDKPDWQAVVNTLSAECEELGLKQQFIK